ncbi:MAG TPA: AAA family ATPase [Terriglobales bacterium]|nr:AAA family ATPase [Terriglobales bacterium]
MKNFILTGAPGSGKTVILRQFELGGFGVVKEAATDIIALEQAQGVAEPWKQPSLIDAIVALQKQRLSQTLSAPEEIQFHDRSVYGNFFQPDILAGAQQFVAVAIQLEIIEFVQRLNQNELSISRRESHVFYDLPVTWFVVQKIKYGFFLQK